MLAGQLIPVNLYAGTPPKRIINWNQGLKEGLTQTTTPELRVKIDKKRAEREKQPDVRKLTTAEMKQIKGSGSYRNKYFQGVLPWQRSLRDVNLCNGNLFKSFTDIQVAPAKGAGLALQRTYNSQDDRVGPFGIGWTHAYDIRMVDENSGTVTDETLNLSDRADFFGGEHGGAAPWPEGTAAGAGPRVPSGCRRPLHASGVSVRRALKRLRQLPGERPHLGDGRHRARDGRDGQALHQGSDRHGQP
jgi:hypothetical protein